MDPRQTQKFVDVDNLLAQLQEPAVVGRPVVTVGPKPRLSARTKTLLWTRELSPPRELAPIADTAVFDMSAVLAQLQREHEPAVTEVLPPRTLIDHALPMQRLEAEHWAREPALGAPTRVNLTREELLESAWYAQPRCSVQAALQLRPLSARLNPLVRLKQRLAHLPSSHVSKLLLAMLGGACVAMAAASLSSALAPHPAVHSAPPAPPPPDARLSPSFALASAPTTEPAADEPNLAPQARPSPADAHTAPTQLAPASGHTPSARAAVDALIAGRHDVALAGYRALAASHPDQPVYQAAARILADTQPGDPNAL